MMQATTNEVLVWAAVIIPIFVIAAWVLVSIAIGSAAERKERSFWSFFWIALVVSPVVGAVIVAALPLSQQKLVAKGRRRSCPHCAETIRPQALVCPFCQSELATRQIVRAVR